MHLKLRTHHFNPLKTQTGGDLSPVTLKCKAMIKDHYLPHLIDKMFEFAELPLKYADVEGRMDEWFCEYTMTEAQNLAWIEYGIDYIKRNSDFGQWRAKLEMSFVNLYCGLRIVG